MVNLNADVSSMLPRTDGPMPRAGKNTAQKMQFGEAAGAVAKHISKVDDLQQSSDMSIKELLSGQNADITSVITTVAKADLSFKLLVGVRNKLIEAYKQTMNMPL